MSNEGVTSIGKAIRENPDSVVSSLNLQSNDISDALPLVELLKASDKIKSLELQGNKLGDAGATALTEALKATHSLEVLDLSNNGASRAGGGS